MADAAREIENLLYTYAERIDAGDLEGVADLFPHGRILPSPEPIAPARIVRAARRVLALYRASTRLYEDGTPRTRHVTTNAIVEVDDGAQTRRRAQLLHRLPADSRTSRCSRSSAGRYHDTFQRIDGRWWFDTRMMFVDLVGDLSRHLLFKLEA